MENNINNFFEKMRGKSIALCGVGVTNTPLAEMLLKKGCKVTVCDKRPAEKLGEVADKLTELGATLKLGADYLEGLDVDVIFRTPGMRFYLPELDAYRKKGVAIISEMEVFFDLCPSNIIAITGSNGKTTTSTVISEILKADGKKVWLGGNIGKALLPDIEQMTADDWVVVELSSFQLISMRRSPDIAVVTNVSPNHLDMHKDMKEYVDAKRNIYRHQSGFGKLIVNADCPIASSFAEGARGACLSFSRTEMPSWGAYCGSDGAIWFCDKGVARRIMRVADIKVPGMHNVENFLAAISAVGGIVSDEAIVKTAREFSGVAHRAELVRELDGVSWYNDSIATTPARTIKGTLSLWQQKILLIAGGYDKKIPFDEMGPAVCDKVKTLILMGVTADKIEKAVRECREFLSSGLEIVRVANMEEAVNAARERAVEGDIVSLSPACASFDMYPNFEARGEHFRTIVEGLESK
ncbi:MAG: UDP-N-acetylmuramoyl-L-alanine--D-glutamate ligase [Clostridia bacterium]|nr:UDP-N-acetylmuramoyl-L-alanine--D-glutamate ligase [Clostridia bacterium]